MKVTLKITEEGRDRILDLLEEELKDGFYTTQRKTVCGIETKLGAESFDSGPYREIRYLSSGLNAVVLDVGGHRWTFHGRRDGLMQSGCSDYAPKPEEVLSIESFDTTDKDMPWYCSRQACLPGYGFVCRFSCSS